MKLKKIKLINADSFIICRIFNVLFLNIGKYTVNRVTLADMFITKTFLKVVMKDVDVFCRREFCVLVGLANEERSLVSKAPN